MIMDENYEILPHNEVERLKTEIKKLKSGEGTNQDVM